MRLLPEVVDRDQYKMLFLQDETWTPAIQYLINKHKLAGVPRRGIRGSHIVYRVGNRWIKMMAPLFARDMVFEVAGLECVKDRLEISTPQISDSGELEGWPYLVFSHVAGERIGDVWRQLMPAEKITLAHEIAQVTRTIQQCAGSRTIVDRGEWNTFITERFERVVTHHRAKGLAEGWLKTLPRFLDQFPRTEFLTSSPVFLHADLTLDHFLVEQTATGPKICGVIDFADCRMGHREYDLPATAAFVLKGEREPLRAYLLGLGFKDGDLDQTLSMKILAWTCLHFFSDLKNYFFEEMKQVPEGDFSALAHMVFPL